MPAIISNTSSAPFRHVVRATHVASLAILLLGATRLDVSAQARDSTPIRIRTGRIIGVFDERTGNPIAGVEVRNLLNGLSAETSLTGTISLFFVDTSGGLLSFKKLGYEPQTLVLANSLTDTVPVTVVMQAAVMLPTVVTKAKGAGDVVSYTSALLRGFEERRQLAFGQFVKEADLRKHDAAQLSDLIPKYITGVALTAPAVGPNAPHSTDLYLVGQRGQASMGQRGACYSTIFIDGGLVYSRASARGTLPPDLRSMNVKEYAGIEYYPGGATVPPQYNMTDSGCGLLLLWTRER